MTSAHLAVLVALGTCVGLSVGSFLNVVIWRFPRGESLVRPRSHCPGCRQPIATRDNVPVLAWLLLRGRCRQCGWLIPCRYPLVEAAVGVSFAVVVALDVGSESLEGGMVPLVARLLYHAILSSLLVCVAMIAHDERAHPGVGHPASAQDLVPIVLAMLLLVLAALNPGDRLGTTLNVMLLVVLTSRTLQSRPVALRTR